jgi:hypothetical protein
MADIQAVLSGEILTGAPPIDPDDSLLTVTDLVRMFEEAEDASSEARKESERDRDYHDNKQLTSDELKELRKRRQPPYIDNRIKSKVDYLVGMEKQQRIDPRCLPRTPAHEEDADAMGQVLRYVSDEQNYDYKRSGVWRNLLIEGSGGVAVAIKTGYNGEPEIELRRIPWDRMFWDPASSEPDFSDAGYYGTVQWMDYRDAIALYPDGEEELNATLTTSTQSDTYDDKPKYTVWADRKRKRVRIVQIWIKQAEEWHFAEYTKGGILKSGPSPYQDEHGGTEPELFFQSAYVDRDNNRFGLVREMVLLQDAINKRNSKALHQLNTAQIVMTKGAVDDVEVARREAARPDGVILVNPVSGNGVQDSFQFNTRTDLAQAQFLLLQEAKNSIDLKGPNATAMGDKAGGSAAASGKAILASQQGGMVSLGDLLDNLRHLDIRVFRAIYNRVRQFYTAEKWVRVTDDDKNVKWAGINIDPMQIQMMMQQNPEAAQKIAGVVGNVSELDCDIIIDEVQQGPGLVYEEFEALVNLKQMDVKGELPFRAIIEAFPQPRVKQRILQKMDEASQQNPQAQAAEELQLRGAHAELQNLEADTMLKQAKAQEALTPDIQAPGQPQQVEYEPPPELQDQKLVAEIRKLLAGAAQSEAAAYKATREADLAPAKFAQEAWDKAEDRRIAARKPAKVA